MKYEKHILPALGGFRYDELTADELNGFISGKLREGLSPKYTADIAGVIRSVCRFAHKHLGFTDRSENMTVPKENVKEKRMLSSVEQRVLVSYLTENPTGSNAAILLSLLTGMRIGELCGLMWADIDLEKRIVTVRQTVQRIRTKGGKTKIVITSPKSKSSVRSLAVPEFIIPFLKEMKKCDSCFFLSGTEKPVEPRTMQYRFKSVLKKLKLNYVTFHSLRHMFATNCITLGCDIKTVSEMLGHSSVKITLDRYFHSSMERKSEYIALLSQTLAAM